MSQESFKKFLLTMKNGSRIALFGSPKQPVQSVPIDLLQLCLTNDIQIEAQSIPRDANQKADIMSRFVEIRICNLRRAIAVVYYI